MMGNNSLDKIKKIVKEFFEKTGFEVGLDFLELKDQTVYVQLKTEEPKVLIGQSGQTLAEIQHILRAIIRKNITEPFYIDVDINDYKKRKTDYLKEIAASLADEVVLDKKEKELNPMPAYERRIIHLELANRGDVITESVGEGLDRRLVIKPA